MTHSSDNATPSLKRDLVYWVVAITFWISVAPTIFFATFRVATIPLLIVIEVVEPDSGVRELLNIVGLVVGLAAAVGLLALVWKQVRGYLANRDAHKPMRSGGSSPDKTDTGSSPHTRVE